MGMDTLDLDAVDRTMAATVGGKGANLGELRRLPGLHVPAGFCVTTDAYARVIGDAPWLDDGTDAAGIRRILEGAAIPADLAAAIAARVAPGTPYAVRSSATAEDLPTASFAGQQESFLGVVGADAVLDAVRRCWASLFTDRAVAYRARRGIDARAVRLAVVVQALVPAEASGVLFTADPVSGDRRVVAIDAAPGLGEDLVAGRVAAEAYRVRDGAVTGPSPALLTDAQALALAAVGRDIEAHFGAPQDVEWCLADGQVHVVQARPITTLFPIPRTGDDARHVFLSVGHQQMMTDAMKPLGLSVWQLEAFRPMYAAAGRLFVDVAAALAVPVGRAAMIQAMGDHDPLTQDALRQVVGEDPTTPAPRPLPAFEPGVADDPAIPAALIRENEASVAALKRDIRGVSGPALFDFIRADIEAQKQALIGADATRALMAGLNAVTWVNAHMAAWLGEPNAADALCLSVPNNVTSEMGLALMDVADAIRPHPEAVAILETTTDARFLDALPVEARDAINAFLDRYGARGVGEIDLTRPRWRERPALLIPMILANVRGFAPGAAARKFAEGLDAAARKEAELLARLSPEQAAEAKRVIGFMRTFIGYREYPKFGIVSRLAVYKEALMQEARLLLPDPEDVFYLTLAEFHEAVRTGRVDAGLVAARKAEHRHHETLTPPRVITSDGEVFRGDYRRADVPAGALAGLGVSAGVVEGRARVVLDVADAVLEPGDILVTPFTDPSWTPWFVSIAGLVTEVGGLMTHGAVIAREYGLPAVVGVEGATTRIRDGQRIRVDGAAGLIELID